MYDSDPTHPLLHMFFIVILMSGAMYYLFEMEDHVTSHCDYTGKGC